MDILMSIRPKWTELIRMGRKTCELRKSRVPEGTERIFVYETAPVQRICGCLEVLRQETLALDALWERTKDFSCVDEAAFGAYYAGRHAGTAIFFGRFVPMAPVPINVAGVLRPPQSWMKLRPEQVAAIVAATKSAKG